jgi:hypothetical protein
MLATETAALVAALDSEKGNVFVVSMEATDS